MAGSPNSPPQPTFEQSVRIMQIICVAMAIGVATFAGIAIFLRDGKQPGESLLSYLAAAFSLVALALSVFVPRFIAKIQPPKQSPATVREQENASADDRLPLIARYQNGMIVGLALLEGGAFFCLVAYLLEGQWWTLVPAGVLWAFMLEGFPTASRMDQWCRQQLENASLDRQG